MSSVRQGYREKEDIVCNTVLATPMDVRIKLQICSHANTGCSYRCPANEGEEEDMEKS